MSGKHKTKALVIHCIDFRFQRQINEDLKKRQLEDQFDRIAWPGASKDFGKVSKACQLSIRLHDPDLILIYQHEDCGAYGKNNSLQTHRTNAQRLENFLRQQKPTISITTLIATFKGIERL